MADPRLTDPIEQADLILETLRQANDTLVRHSVAMIEANRLEDEINALGDEMLDDDDMFRVIKERAALIARREELIREANKCERKMNGLAWDLVPPKSSEAA